MWFTVTLQVSDRACDEGVRVMDKGVEKAGAVLDKGASIKLCNSCCSKPSQIPEKKSAFFNQSLPSSCRLQKALTVAIRSSSYSCRLSQLTGCHAAGYSGHPTVGPEEAKRIREKHPETWIPKVPKLSGFQSSQWLRFWE